MVILHFTDDRMDLEQLRYLRLCGLYLRLTSPELLISSLPPCPPMTVLLKHHVVWSFDNLLSMIFNTKLKLATETYLALLVHIPNEYDFFIKACNKGYHFIVMSSVFQLISTPSFKDREDRLCHVCKIICL